MHTPFAARLPSAGVFEPGRQILSSGRSRFQGQGAVDARGSGLSQGWRWDGLRARGAAGPAGQEGLPFAALFFNPFLLLLVFIAHIFPVTVSLGFHPF